MNNHTENNIALLTDIMSKMDIKGEVKEKQYMQLSQIRELLLNESRELNTVKKRHNILKALNNICSIDLLYHMVKHND